MRNNTLHQVTNNDFLGFKICISTFMDWYVRNCDTIREISDAWIESEEDTLVSILSRGLTDLVEETREHKMPKDGEEE